MTQQATSNDPENTPEGGAGGEGGQDPQGQTPDPNQQQSKTVSAEQFDHVKNDMHKFKDENRDLKKRLKELEDGKLQEQNNWKELAERRAEELKEKDDEISTIKGNLVTKTRFDAALDACKKAGLRDEAVSDLRNYPGLNEKIQIETTSLGHVNVHGAAELADELKAVKPHWFQEASSPNINTKTPGVVNTGGAVTPAMLSKAQREGKKKGDLSEYRSLYETYRKQQANSRV